MTEWFLYRKKRYQKVGEIYEAGIARIMLLPEEIGQLHKNHEYLLIVDESDSDLTRVANG